MNAIVAQPYQVIVYNAATGSWQQFDDPVEIVQTGDISEVARKLAYIEEAVNRDSLQAAGMIAYGAAPGLDPALTVVQQDSFPLLWFGLYRSSCEITLPRPQQYRARALPDWQPTITPDVYRSSFDRVKQHIRNGDSYQVNYTYRLRAAFESDPFDYFLRLIAAQGRTYGAYIDTGRWVVASSSPELYFSLNRSEIESRPMKGTAARGLTWEQDRRLAQGLRRSEKERAENLMIVDMVRNDLGRIARIGSVHVPHLFALEQYPTVWQLTSTVKAETDATITEIFKATFPPASITGAPKGRTMQIIAELESTPRQIYTGAIGYISPGRQAQFNVAIRTLLLDRQTSEGEYGIGGGIVWDSVCENEQRECRTKALVLGRSEPEFELLETVLWLPNTGYSRFDLHLARISRSAAYFAYPFDMQAARTQLEALAATLPANDHKVRLLVSRNGSIRCEAHPLTSARPDRLPRVGLASQPVDSQDRFLYHKTTHRVVYEAARVSNPGCDDVILHNERGEVTESTIANVVVESDGKLFTPPVECGLLTGICRQVLLEAGEVAEQVITIEQLLRSDRIYLANSVRGLYEVKLEVARSFSLPTAR